MPKKKEKDMNNSVTTISAFYAFTAALLLSCCVAQAQDDADSDAYLMKTEGKAEQPKLVLELGAPFCDNAILQREMELPVWGWSKPGTKITVSFAGQQETAEAGKDGKWMLKLKPLKASAEPAEMVVQESGVRGQESGKKVVLKNILVGEVWMASGQSNMQWIAGKCDVAKLIAAFTAKGQRPPIREFQVTSVYAMLHPIEKATGAWTCDDYANYSAIAFAFAHKLYEELQVPIGILNCSFSQTAIQAWIPRQGFATGTDEYTQAIYKKIRETDPTTPEHKVAWDTFYKSLEDQIQANEARVKKGEAPKEVSAKTPGNMNDNRDASWMFNGRLNPVIPYAVRGAIWNQGYANMGEGLPYYNNLHSLIRGWRIVWGKPELPVYFHQFYCPGQKGGGENKPSIDGTAEMRLGTWLARDIPHAGMASQIDVTGAIHYSSKTVPGQRLALHALKNQYGKKVEAEGPMFKSYEVKGDKLIISFDNAQGGLVVAETGSNAIGKGEGATGFSNPKIIEKGDEQVKLFSLADKDGVWYPATMKIEGDTVVVTSPKVKQPHGVSYGTGGVGFQPNLYNKALLPLTPFIYYDNKLVTSKTWPGGQLKIAGEVLDPSKVGLLEEWRKMPILSTQFRDNAVLQADKPVTIWGSTRLYGEWGGPAEGKVVIHFSFDDIRKTIEVPPEMEEWQVTLPVMKAGTTPHTLKVSCTINGELAHERVCTNIVFGEVWYVAAPSVKFNIPAVKPSGQIVRVLENESKRSEAPMPSRFSVAVSRTPKPDNRFASYWKDASGLAGAFGQSIAAKTGRPVGIIFMDSKVGKGGMNPGLKSWIGAYFLNQAPSLMEDYKIVGSQYPGTPYYNDNIKNYIADWKNYWSKYIPEMIATKAVPDGAKWGSYPSSRRSAGESKATGSYNVSVASFLPAALRGIIFLSSDGTVAQDQGVNFGPEMTALATCLKTGFGGEDVPFVYTIPSKDLAPQITAPDKIKGKSIGVEIKSWSEVQGVIDQVINKVYQ